MIWRQDGRDEYPLVKAERFALGRLFMTPGVRDAIPPSEITRALRRHARGDWGDVDVADREANEQALKQGTRLMSVFHSKRSHEFWVITEADRSVTTVLLPEEY